MPQPRLSARKLKRIFALFEEGRLNRRQIARRIGISCSTLWRYLGLYFRCRIRYPDILDLNEREFFAKLLPHKKKSRTYPIWSTLSSMKCPGLPTVRGTCFS